MGKTQVRYYPVGDGSMTLIKLNDSRCTTILVDLCVSSAADDKNKKDVYDAAGDLRKHLEKDGDGRDHLNLLIHSHGDDDHVHGLQNHFWLGDPKDYTTKEGEPKKIIIDEIWSSTRYRKYDTQSFKLGEDAKALSKEIRRRVDKLGSGLGDLVHILGDDMLDDDSEVVPESIRYRLGAKVDSVAGKWIDIFTATVLGPLGKEEGEDEESYNDKNRGSLIVRLDCIVKDLWGQKRTVSLLFGDDTEVRTWERLYEARQREQLSYDILLAPHHSSWHSLSHDSSDDEDAEVSENAKKALNNKKVGAYIILSCLSDADEGDESKKRGRAKARPVYEEIVGKKKVLCTGESKSGDKPLPIVFTLTMHGASLEHTPPKNTISIASTSTIGEPLPHG